MLPVHTPRPRRCKATVGRDSIKEWNDVALKIAEGVLAIRHDNSGGSSFSSNHGADQRRD
jgi:hypothetical protein